MNEKWFVFDIGNVLITLDYDRTMRRVEESSRAKGPELVTVFSRILADFERGRVGFDEVHDFMRDRAGYLGGSRELREIWNGLLARPVEGIDELLTRARQRYHVAFLSNCNEVHEEEIARRFGNLFLEDERIVYSHHCGSSKPDRQIYQRMLELLEAPAGDVIFIDDMLENVRAARQAGIEAYQFESVSQMTELLEKRGVL